MEFTNREMPPPPFTTLQIAAAGFPDPWNRIRDGGIDKRCAHATMIHEQALINEVHMLQGYISMTSFTEQFKLHFALLLFR